MTIPITGVSDLPVIVCTTKGCGNWQPGATALCEHCKANSGQVRGVQWCIVAVADYNHLSELSEQGDAAGTYYVPGSFGRGDCSGESTEL